MQQGGRERRKLAYMIKSCSYEIFLSLMCRFIFFSIFLILCRVSTR